MALGEMLAGLSRAAESTRRRIQNLLGRSRNPLRLVLSERQTHRKRGLPQLNRVTRLT